MENALISAYLLHCLNLDSQETVHCLSLSRRINWYWNMGAGVKGWRSGESTRLPPIWLGLDTICGLSLLLVLVLAPTGFSLVFPSPQKTTFPNSNSIFNPRSTGL